MDEWQVILEGVRGLIEEGGTLAIWGIVAYMLMVTVRVAVTGGIIWLCIRSVFSGLTSVVQAHRSGRVSRLSILSEQASEDLQAQLKTIFSSVKSALHSVEQAAKRLEDSASHGTKNVPSEQQKPLDATAQDGDS